jgi:hypothetical protein
MAKKPRNEEANRSRWAKPGERERMSELVRAQWADPQFRAERSRINKKAQNRPEVRAKKKARFADPMVREPFVAFGKTSENVIKKAESLRVQAATPEAKAVRSAASKKMWAERREEILANRAATRRRRKG